MSTPSSRIPVCNSDGAIIERVDSARALRLSLAPNATLVRKRRRGQIVRILLASIADDSLLDARQGDPRARSHKHETKDNPEKVWTLKRIPTETQDLYQLSVSDCLKKAA